MTLPAIEFNALAVALWRSGAVCGAPGPWCHSAIHNQAEFAGRAFDRILWLRKPGQLEWLAGVAALNRGGWMLNIEPVWKECNELDR